MFKAFITGLAGHVLSNEEAAFLRAECPAGLILFARNCSSHNQIKALIADALEAIGDKVLVLIDQEGGRVQRLRPPLGRQLPAGAAYGAFFDKHGKAALQVARSVARLMAHDLKTLGINANCTPVLDLPVPGSHDIIGDRALARSVAAISALGRAIAEGHIAGGVLPIMKHIPGHGRAREDSHLKLPRVDAARSELSATDFAPFRNLSYLPAAMTAHIVYSAIDASAPASTSAIVIGDVVRGEIGFDGLLMSDDLSMHALTGSLGQRARGVLEAGCDLALHCNGDMAEMAAVAAETGALEGLALARYEQALAVTREMGQFDIGEAEKRLARLLSEPIRPSESV